MASCSGALVRFYPVAPGYDAKSRGNAIFLHKAAITLATPRGRLRKTAIHASTEDSTLNHDDKAEWMEKIAAPAAALTLCALLSGAVIPEEAMAARTGGRMGGSSFRARPAPSMPRRGGGGGYRQYNYYGSPGIAPPLVGGYGYGMGGYGIMPSFFFPIGFGGIFNVFILMFVLSAVFNVVRDFQRRDDRDDFDDDF